MQGCIFCQIIARQSPSSVVYEDDLTLAFMNIRQVNPGHVLVIPKTHVETIYDLDATAAARLFQTVVLVANAIKASLKPEGLTLFQANGVASFQEVFHIHIHLLPRRSGDGLLRYYPDEPALEKREELDRLAEKIRGKL